MPPLVTQFVSRLLNADRVVCEGQVIPPAHLRVCGNEFKEDAFFVKSARGEARRLEEKLGLTAQSSVLDLGCGAGRLAIGLGEKFPSIKYFGFDVSRPSISWCRRHLASRNPNFTFEHIDLWNPRYNPKGVIRLENYKLPVPDASVDIVYMYSVFSHLKSGDISLHLKDFRRLLKPTGRIFLTAFAEEGVPDETENPGQYQQNWKGPLHCVRFSRTFLESLFSKAGFRVQEFVHGRETDGQSGYVLS